MNEDSTVAQLYQESFKAAKADGEREMDQLKDLHDRFDYYFDEERMANKLPTEWYDLKVVEDAEHIQYSTDFTDQGEDVVYKRYKMQQYRTREDIKDHQARIDNVVREAEAPGGGLREAQQEAADDAGVEAKSFVTLLHRLRSKKTELVLHDRFLVSQIAELKYQKALRHKDKLMDRAVYEDDPIFGDYRPDWSQEPEHLRNLALLPEIRKMEFSTLPEYPEASVVDEESARDFEDDRTMRHSYYKAKLAFFEDCFRNQRQLRTHDFETKREAVEAEDEWMDAKLEFMYDALDYDHDRAKVRDKFLAEVNKRVTLADVGETLDKLMYESKGEYAKYYDVVKHHGQKPRAPAKDYTSEDFKWSGRLLRALDPKSPLWLDDPNQIDEAPEYIAEKVQQVYDRVKYEDEQTDHSYASLTKNEKTEIALFHSLKQDPYFKHYIHNHLREQAEHEDEVNFHFPLSSMEKRDIYDHVKLDKMNLFDFRRNLPMKERQARIDSKARAYGYGKRKRSRALVSVEPGSGKITVNGKPLLQALLLPMQRSRILLPLVLTQYTCLLDVKIKVWGGGFNGQVEAIIPALARALQGFDVQTRKPLKYFGLMRHDPRTKERKKIGKQKARKGQVYRRR